MQCTGIILHQRLVNGFLGGPYNASFSVDHNNRSFSICIEQIGIRKITISTETAAALDSFVTLFNSLDMMLMLMDGEFLQIEKAETVNGDDQASDELIEYFKQRPGLYTSADFTRGSHSKFIEFDAIVSADMLAAWFDISKELDILHNMVLYSMADTGITVDCKCAVLIEAYKALSELLLQRVDGFSITTNKKQPSLKERLKAIILKYGQDIFITELQYEDNFLQTLVHSRNRIAHIKSNQGENYLTGEESVLYVVKLSYLYRRVLLDLLGVNYSLYSEKLKDSITKWDEWEGILSAFIKKLK